MPEVTVVTWTAPVTATQVTSKVVRAVSRVAPPVVTCSVRGFTPATVQFPAAPKSPTLWSPPLSPSMMAAPLRGSACSCPPSTRTV